MINDAVTLAGLTKRLLELEELLVEQAQELRDRKLQDILITCRGSEHMEKASIDPFDYAVCLVTGEVYYFEDLIVSGDFIRLRNVRERVGPNIGRDKGGNPSFDRGLDIAINAIVWICDAPYGS